MTKNVFHFQAMNDIDPNYHLYFSQGVVCFQIKIHATFLGKQEIAIRYFTSILNVPLRQIRCSLYLSRLRSEKNVCLNPFFISLYIFFGGSEVICPQYLEFV